MQKRTKRWALFLSGAGAVLVLVARLILGRVDFCETPTEPASAEPGASFGDFRPGAGRVEMRLALLAPNMEPMDESFYVLAFSDGTWATGNTDRSGITAPVHVTPSIKLEVYAGAEAQKYWQGRILDASEADRKETGHPVPCVPVSIDGGPLMGAVRCID